MESLVRELQDILAREFKASVPRRPPEFCAGLRTEHPELYSRLAADLPYLRVTDFFGTACSILDVPDHLQPWFLNVVRLLKSETAAR